MIYTEILEVNLFAFAYRLPHEDFSPIYEALFTQPFSIFIYINLAGFLINDIVYNLFNSHYVCVLIWSAIERDS